MKRRTKETEPELGDRDLSGEIMTMRQAADYLHCDYNTVGKIVRRGDIPVFRVGSEYRIRREDLRKWIAQQAVSPGESLPPKVARGSRKS
jgi:excisionase family DNA binding protein